MPARTLRAAPAVLFLALALPACSATAPTPAPSQPLRAALVTPTDIDLNWTDGRPDVAGHVLEFATAETGPYTPLQYLARHVTTYRHPDLMPHTTFVYRLRAYRGPASAPVRVDLPPGKPTAADENSPHDWLPPRDRPGTRGARHALRTGSAAPGELRAVIKHANGIHFTWRDNSSDEDGFLLEIRRTGGGAYEPVAVLDPDVDSTGLITLPDEKHASYRVRALVLGERSQAVRLTTGE
ncbi:hypothetical protein ADL00_33070 [Streptomyces sp. AS58]|uniref:fibronectin type III domain-containing protein n=1 Tax=Streptomyces sp. AS58 TaxID=1519489 RepID=UPI0006AF1A74|nr:fibronectin type III domain-containing protein [Streptomyces sp. AS58]KOV53976.1 hypothetical protein ADL00_33070 [Streptomyces sp. AS58]